MNCPIKPKKHTNKFSVKYGGGCQPAFSCVLILPPERNEGQVGRVGQHESGIRPENLKEMGLRGISGSLSECIVRPLGKLPLSQEKDIRIWIFS
jgi:hypothetical protein